jgi:hypothetical protein
MFRARILLVAVLAASALAVLAVPASASVPAANSKFCTAAAKIGKNTAGSSGLSKTRAKKLVSQFKATAKNAPAKVKSAINNITKFLGLIAGTTDPSDLQKVYTSSSFKNYSSSVTTFFTYTATQCSGT